MLLINQVEREPEVRILTNRPSAISEKLKEQYAEILLTGLTTKLELLEISLTNI